MKGKSTLQEVFGHSVGFDTVKPIELLINLFSFFLDSFRDVRDFRGSESLDLSGKNNPSFLLRQQIP